jgi:hypothetical protein
MRTAIYIQKSGGWLYMPYVSYKFLSNSKAHRLEEKVGDTTDTFLGPLHSSEDLN